MGSRSLARSLPRTLPRIRYGVIPGNITTIYHPKLFLRSAACRPDRLRIPPLRTNAFEEPRSRFNLVDVS